MRALIQDGYGPPEALRMGERPVPQPGEGQVLVRVRAASLNGSDREHLAGRPLYARLGGLRRPRHPVPGSDVAGTVEAVGAGVSAFVPGDEVFGELEGYRGALAEYAVASARLLAPKPPALSFVQAAAIPQAGCIALRATAGLHAGDRVLVNGAGGSGGAFVLALARQLGAQVTAVDRAGKAAHMVRAGADRTVDFAAHDWADERASYDRIVDLIGHRGPQRVHRTLRPQGAYLVVGGSTGVLLATAIAGPLLGRATGKRVRMLVVPQSRTLLEEVTAMLTVDDVDRAIDGVHPFDEAPAALARLAAGDALGKIVVEMP
ncbi:NAD(P)-dependent alcohol dehydrogenase [Agrococcus beijingensis]|uniref:NAD(P)-dependent alcohol dehydrogenase n=1 Tax=Agrococcus beijingensis TaxID=3068634 RepID=UPI002742860D|nr:NAD(P)-dependent alcohol dehydrogenase [Agrococcus sp. REN33]